MKTKYLYLFLFFAIVNALFAQDPVSIKLSEKEGLPDVEFYDIIEDPNHVIWLAADKGLFSFNGKEYVGYSNVLKRGLSVFGLKMDSENRLWCNNISGQFFYVENEKLVLFLDLKEELKGELAEFLFLKNKLIIFSKKQIYIVDLKTKNKESIKADSILKFSMFGSPFLTNGTMYFSVNNILYSFQEDFKIVKTKLYFSEFGSKFNTKFFKFKKELFICVYDVFENKNRVFRLVKDKLIPLSLPLELVQTRIISFTSINQKLFFSTIKGVYDLTIVEDEIKINDNFFKNEIVSKTIIDFNKNYWFTTTNNGIFIVPNIAVKKYDLHVENATISCVTNFEEKTIYGTSKGELVFLNKEKIIEGRIQLNDKIKVTALGVDLNGDNLFVSTENNAYIYSFKSNKIITSKYFINAKQLQFNNKNELLYTSFDRAEVLRFSSFQLINQKILNKKRAYNSLINSVSNDLYVAYVDELIKYDENYTTSKITIKGEQINAIDIAKTNNNVIWIGTFNKGLIGLRPNGSKIEFTTKNGLLSNLIQIIKADNDKLWIVSDRGVQVLNVLENTFRTIELDNNFTTPTIVDIVVLKESVLFVNQTQLFELKKGIETTKMYENDVYISKIEVNEEEISLSEKLLFSHDKNRLGFYFHSNGFFPNAEINYEYRLQGNSDNWIKVDRNQHYVKFNSLPSGSYVFDIRVSNNKNNLKSVSFEITKPFWKRWWFLTSCFLFLFLLMIAFYKYKLQAKEKEKQDALDRAKHEKELINLKLENLKSQMNPHFIFNALNSIQEYIVLNQKNLASTYLSKFANLIRAYLEHSSKGKISLKEEIDCLNIYLELEKLRFEEKLNYSVLIDENIDVYDVKIPTMLIQPYVENSLKHGLLHKNDNRMLTIEFALNKVDNILECSVEDNGVGREKSASLSRNKHKSFASNATEKRLNLLNNNGENKIGVKIIDLFSENNQAIGTRVVVFIPMLK